MSEHELFIARKKHESRIFHGKFRRTTLKAEKRRRLMRLAVKSFLNK